MSSNELLDALERLLDDENVSQETIKRLAPVLTLALALDNRSRQNAQQEQMAAELEELRRLIREQSENVGRLTRVVERTEAHVRMHPSLLYFPQSNLNLLITCRACIKAGCFLNLVHWTALQIFG